MKLIKGDLLNLAINGEFDAIVHGCNCFNTMGSGIAKQIKERFPSAYEIDSQTISGDYNKLGQFTETVEIGHLKPFHLINAYTQYGFNKNGETKDLFEYISFKLILQKLNHKYGYARLRWGFPMIGMGLAGGNKSLIQGLINDFSYHISENGGTVTLVEFDK